MDWILNTAVFLFFFLFMEFVAWFTHKYVMHGFLWILHKDHHLRDGRKFEWNDLFALIFAIPSMLLIYFGAKNGFTIWFYAGMGIAAYGLAYFLFHDVLVHRRMKLFENTRSKFIRAVYSAHIDHHTGKKNYGFLFMFNPKYHDQKNQYDLYSKKY